jgi:hypothetical protein
VCVCVSLYIVMLCCDIKIMYSVHTAKIHSLVAITSFCESHLHICIYINTHSLEATTSFGKLTFVHEHT